MGSAPHGGVGVGKGRQLQNDAGLHGKILVLDDAADYGDPHPCGLFGAECIHQRLDTSCPCIAHPFATCNIKAGIYVGFAQGPRRQHPQIGVIMHQEQPQHGQGGAVALIKELTWLAAGSKSVKRPAFCLCKGSIKVLNNLSVG